MIASLAAPVAGPDPNVACVFDRARALAAGGDAPEAIADRVVAACTAAAGDGAPVDGMRRFRVREAALSMVYRSRGIDKLPADAPIRLPQARTPSQRRLHRDCSGGHQCLRGGLGAILFE